MLTTWLQTKKRGRDDDQIEADRRQAEEARKKTKKKATKKKAPPTKKKKTTTTTTKKKKAASNRFAKYSASRQQPASTSSETDESLDEFVVEEDDDEEEWDSGDDDAVEEEEEEEDEPEWKSDQEESSDSSDDDEEEEEEEEEELVVEPPRSNKDEIISIPSSDEDDDDDDEDDVKASFLPTVSKVRASKPPAAVTKVWKTLQQGKSARSQRRKPPSNVVSLSDSDDDSSNDENTAKRPKKSLKKNARKRVSRPARLQDSDDLTSPEPASAIDALEDTPSPRPRPRPRPRGRVLQAPTGRRTAAGASILESMGRPTTSTTSGKSSDDDSVLVQSRFFSKTSKSKVSRQAPLSNNNNHINKNDDGASSMDEDEATALNMALEASKKDHQQQAEEVIELVDDEEEDGNDDDDDEQEAYVSKEEQAATSVLEAANDLSRQVVQAMRQWGNQRKNQENFDSLEKEEDVVPMGMIVDGAMAMGSLGLLSTNNDNNDKSGDPNITNTSSPNHQGWISKETMAKILPGVTLAEYQLIGVNWMALLHGMQCKVGGSVTNVNGILADEMGLGKTVQTIAFLSWWKHQQTLGQKDTPCQPHLIVAPSAVIQNWVLEIEKFAPHLNIVKYHGTQAERRQLQMELHPYRKVQKTTNKQAPLDLPPLDVIIAPMTYFQKEDASDRSFLRKFQYDYMVVDEAHCLKNPKGTRYASLDRFQTQHRLLLTGTPVQNSPQELMSLLCFLIPLFSKPLKMGTREEHDDGDDDDDDDDRGYGGKTSSANTDGGQSMLRHFVSVENKGQGIAHGEDSEQAYAKLKQLFAPFVLRRRKKDVLAQVMPPKHHRVELIPLDSTARTKYEAVIQDHLEQKKQKHGRRGAFSEHLFTNLRKAAHHPLLLRFHHTKPEEKEHLCQYFYRYGAFKGQACTQERVAQELDGFNDFDIHLTALELIQENSHRKPDLERYLLSEDDLFASPKVVRLRRVLEEMLPKGHRILIFSGWTSILDLLGCLMEQMGLQHLRMEGSTPVSERQALIDEFNTNASIPVFLLSTRACGLGINLTAANVCVLYDLDFNPFNDLQAQDRCHRIGQKKPVTVVKLVAQDTVDEDIYQLQQRKAQMNAAIMESNKNNDGENEWKKTAAKEKKALLKNAMDRFLLQSPDKPKNGTVKVDRDGGAHDFFKPAKRC